MIQLVNISTSQNELFKIKIIIERCTRYATEINIEILMNYCG